jgi:hypothetical protein
VLESARVHQDDPLHQAATDVVEKLAKTFSQMELIINAEGAAQQLTGMDAPITSAAGIGMIMSLAVLDDWLLTPGSPQPAAARVTNEITTMILHGISHRLGVMARFSAGGPAGLMAGDGGHRYGCGGGRGAGAR